MTQKSYPYDIVSKVRLMGVDHHIKSIYLSELIPGLPEEVALECLTRLHYTSHRVASQVCQRWRGLFRSTDFYCLRKRTGKTHKAACLVQSLPLRSETGASKPTQRPSFGISVFDPESGTWDRVEPIPKYPYGLPLFCQVTCSEGKLIVLGGWDPSSWDPVKDVFLYDFTTRRWTQCQEMPSIRSFFAVGATEGGVLIAGGHDKSKNALKSAWIYDIRGNNWSELPDMSEERDESEGVVIGSEFWVVSGYDTESQGRFKSSCEVYELGTGQWRRVENSWTTSQCPRSCVGVGKNGILTSLAELDPSVRVGTSGVDLGDRLLLIGSPYQGAPLGFLLIHRKERKNRNLLKVDVTDEFSGFVQSACTVEI